MSVACPFSVAELAERLAPLGPFGPRLAVAVSGGADSMALALLAAEWAPGRILGLTVDHGLRPESAAEAAEVAGWLAARGIPHRILARTGPPPASRVQERLRADRYRLLAAACRAEGIGELLVAHHAADQLETVLMRLGRGSGLTGLVGMAAAQRLEGVRVLRPLLDVEPERLRAALALRGQRWIEDPSNRDPRYGRTRMRAALPALGSAGLTARSVGPTLRHLAAAETALAATAAELTRRSLAVDPAGFARLALAPLASQPPELVRRVVTLALAELGARPPLRFERIERLAADLAQGLPCPRTAAGFIFARERAGPERGGGAEILVCREAGRIRDVQPAGPGSTLWDGRFVLELAACPAGARIAALGDAGWRRVLAARPALARHPIPYRARLALPAVWRDRDPVAVPHLGYGLGPDGDGTVAIGGLAFRPRDAGPSLV